MRNLICFRMACFLLAGATALAGAAETWRWKDANGVVHYSDRPMPGAERVSVVAPKPSSTPPKVTGQDPAAAPASGSVTREAVAIVPYTRCVIVAPDAEETFNAVNSVAVGVHLEPSLQEGHRLELRLDGTVVTDWPPDALTHTVTDLLRGAHTVAARVLDADGTPVCTGPTLTFYIRLPTVPQLRATPR
jgi:Domain of unknown function (DUF4124)